MAARVGRHGLRQAYASAGFPRGPPLLRSPLRDGFVASARGEPFAAEDWGGIWDTLTFRKYLMGANLAPLRGPFRTKATTGIEPV
jgi:hypothetical protein